MYELTSQPLKTKGFCRAIPLTQGKVAFVSEEDYEAVSKFKWYASQNTDGRWEAWRTERVGHTKKHIKMSRFILYLGSGVSIEGDHINGFGLDNRRNNLRMASHQQNMWNRKKQSNNTSGYIGVSWDSSNKKWRVSIHTPDGTVVNLGRYLDKEEAARVYDASAKKLHGEFARLNFPNG